VAVNLQHEAWNLLEFEKALKAYQKFPKATNQNFTR
jgi:hypothetical protein